jgi:hypothetical protein
MKAISQLRRRSEAKRRSETFSAWVMSILFAAIAASSFAVDQSVIASVAFGQDGTEFGSLPIGECFREFPLRLIESLVGKAHDRQ